MRGMLQQLGNLGTISVFACRHRENKKNLCRGGRSQDLPDTDIQPAVRQKGISLEEIPDELNGMGHPYASDYQLVITS